MHTMRIVKLADGEELISSEIAGQDSVIEDDPRREILEHRRQASASASDTPAR
jgi:hypothetical protein